MRISPAVILSIVAAAGPVLSRQLSEISVRELIDALEARQAEDITSVFARDVQDANSQSFDESGALRFGDFVPVIGTIIDNLFGRRDVSELSARDLIDELVVRQDEVLDESGAIRFGDFIPFLGPVIDHFFGSRDLDELYAREFDEGLVARDTPDQPAPSAQAQGPDDESGAFGLGGLLPLVGSLLGGFFNKREDLHEFVAREVVDALVTRKAEDLDESGALRFGDFLPFVGPLVDLVFGGSNQQQRRDIHEAVVRELFSREAIGQFARPSFRGIPHGHGDGSSHGQKFARSLNELD